MLTIDANILIAWLSRKDASHALAVDILDSHEWDEFATSTMTLAEVLVRAARHGEYQDRLTAVTELGVHLIGVDGEAVRTMTHLTAEHGLRGPDAAVLAVAMRASSAIATLDKKLAAVARRLDFPVVDAPADDLDSEHVGSGGADTGSAADREPAWWEREIGRAHV